MMIEMICNNSRAADEKTLMPNFLFQDENSSRKTSEPKRQVRRNVHHFKDLLPGPVSV